LADFQQCEFLGPTPDRNVLGRESRANFTFAPLVNIPEAVKFILKERQLGKNVFQFPDVCPSMNIGISASKWPPERE